MSCFSEPCGYLAGSITISTSGVSEAAASRVSTASGLLPSTPDQYFFHAQYFSGYAGSGDDSAGIFEHQPVVGGQHRLAFRAAYDERVNDFAGRRAEFDVRREGGSAHAGYSGGAYSVPRVLRRARFASQAAQ